MTNKIEKYSASHFEALSKMLRSIGKNEMDYKQALKETEELPDDQRSEKEQEAYYQAMENYQDIINRYSNKVSPTDTVETIEDILANVARDAMIAAILEALKPPEKPGAIKELETTIHSTV